VTGEEIDPASPILVIGLFGQPFITFGQHLDQVAAHIRETGNPLQIFELSTPPHHVRQTFLQGGTPHWIRGDEIAHLPFPLETEESHNG